MREAVFILAERTAWSLNELLDLDEDELIAWLETGNRVSQLVEQQYD